MGRLNGFKKRITSGVFGGADHTYVTSDQGDAWDCWGGIPQGNSGGTQICSGSGIVSRARCLSQPSSQAGIIYAVTGVCHQTSNRILFPSGTLVSAAAGYWPSMFVWGTYGKDAALWLAPWGRVNFCYATNWFRKPTPAGKKRAAKRSRVRASTKALLANVLALHESSRGIRGQPDLKVLADKETDLLLDHLAPEPLPSATKNKIIGLRQQTDGRLRTLADMVYAGKIDGATFASDGNAAITELFRKVAGVLGAHAYSAMFGYPPQVDVNLIDPTIAAKSFTNK